MIKKNHIRLRGYWMVLALLLLSITPIYSQQQLIRVTGKVIDEQGEALIGVSVRVKDQRTGTITDANGQYMLQASPSSSLVFSYVGYISQELAVNPSGVMNISMAGEQQLNEVVVVGYGSMKKKDVTGGLSVVGKEQLEMVSTNNLMDRLVGQVAGFSITTTNAAPGQDQTLLIRGENSLSASNSPLIVLDGIPYSGSLTDLDPNNIENLTVLKDASAVAIYGSRGSNGVILVQTKRGMEGKPQVAYRGQLGVAEPMQRIDVMGPDEYIRLQQDIGRLKEGYTGELLDPVAGNIISLTERENYIKGITHDWQDYIFRKALTTDHQLSISGGTEKTKYMAAAAYLSQEGVVYNSKLTRYNLSTNIDQTFNDWLTTGIGVQFVQREDGGVTPNIEHAIKQSPYGKYQDEMGNYVYEPMEYSLITNPMLNVNADQDRTNRNFFLSAYANILLPIEGLSFRTNYGYNYRSNFTGTYYGRNTFIGREQAGQVGGSASINNGHNTNYTWENILKYEREIDEHRFDATALFSIQETKGVSAAQSGDGFVTDNTSYYMMNTAERNITMSSGLSETAMLSYMFRLNYAYKGKYMATLTGRSDGASVFGVNNKYAFFPSAALAWQVGEEHFIKDNFNWVSMLKLRASYGANGNQAITAYRTLDRLYSNVKYIWGDGGTAVNTAYLAGDGVGNPNLKWETTYTTNLGLDFQLFNNRLGGAINLYRSKTKDLLMMRTVPIMNGYNRIWDNVGETRNKGIEVALNSVNIDKKDFQWSSNLNFSLNRDKIVELRGDHLDDIANNWFIDKPLRVFYDYNMVGLWQEGDAYTYSDAGGNEREVQTGAEPGSAKLEDVDGNGYIDANDRKIIGSKMPSFTASIGNRINYKNFYFSCLVNGVFGVWRDDNLANMGSWTFGITNYVQGANYWTPENPNGAIVSPGYNNSFGHGYYKKVSYVEIKNITIGYRIGQKTARKVGLNAIDMNLSVNNLHTFSNIRQVLNYDNSWMASFPTARSYMLGLNLTF
ncbi:SusC/RagA family TonB-linked outer membrane protein [Olivibacter domesticus]|uniref:TonB-linked outer membrane protein, SusC/RagA family n=1 Tax=Olivibacter domesticus TaxID=407022 RepID=A0A1H7K5K4_OLID1|nr:TonB-dependent receptor [Olivibacter domesticus]SEK82109.1 TonB-linked outer membrane protein, SusC/RagA family [Olivibacter domesticus]